MSVFFLTVRSLSCRPAYRRSEFSSMMVEKQTAMSPSAMTMLLLTAGSLDVSSTLKRSMRCSAQNSALTHMNLLSARVAAVCSIGFCERERTSASRVSSSSDTPRRM